MKLKKIISATIALWVLVLLFRISPSAESGVYYSSQICDGEMKIALTFDDGPHPRKTPEILDILSRYDIRATFFLIGQNVEYYPETAKMILKAGHEIGNHTYSHPHNMNKTNESEIFKEMEKCERAIKKELGYKPVLFRPPEGVVDSHIKAIATNGGYKVILWSLDTRDWAGVSADKIVSEILENIRPGDIILMHDYTGKKAHTIEALEKMIPLLLEKGYSFATVSELIDK